MDTVKARVVLSALAAVALLTRQAAAVPTSIRETAPRLEVVGFNGQIQVRAPQTAKPVLGNVQTPAIPPGSEVHVLSGRAVFQSANMIIRAKAGDVFLFHAPLPIGGKQRCILLVGLGEQTALDVAIGDTQAVLRSGAAVSIRDDGPGKAHFEVHMGKVVVSTKDEITSLTPGMSIESTVPAGLSGEATAEAEILSPQEREELRSAPAPAKVEDQEDLKSAPAPLKLEDQKDLKNAPGPVAPATGPNCPIDGKGKSDCQ